MFFVKYASALALASALVSGCGPAVPGTDSNQEQLRIGGMGDANSALAFGGQIAGTTVTGLYYSTAPRLGDGVTSPTGWWVRSSSTDLYAPVEQLTYNDQAVTSLSAAQGYLQVATGDREEPVRGTDFTLLFAVGAPLNAQLRVVSASDEGSYARYVTEWSADGKDSWSSFCPHPYVDRSGVSTTLLEHMIPVGGAKWGLNGSRVDDSAAIQLSCTHDMIGGCVRWRLPPWQSEIGADGTAVSLQDWHQACTRMKRNDICGTGDPSTTLNQGASLQTILWHWDSLGPSMAPQTRSTMEAFWGVSGATCYNPGEFRSDDPVAISRMQIQLALCPKPTCSSGSYSGLVGSARPCLAIDRTTGDCVAN